MFFVWKVSQNKNDVHKDNIIIICRLMLHLVEIGIDEGLTSEYFNETDIIVP